MTILTIMQQNKTNEDTKKKPTIQKKTTKLDAKAKKEYDRYKQKYFDYYELMESLS